MNDSIAVLAGKVEILEALEKHLEKRIESYGGKVERETTSILPSTFYTIRFENWHWTNSDYYDHLESMVKIIEYHNELPLNESIANG